MLCWVPIFQFATKMSPWLHHPSSSSFFFNGVFKSDGESNLWILPLHKARYIPLLKPKQQLKTHKCARNRKAAKKTKKPGAGGDARSCTPRCTTVHPSPRSVVTTMVRPWWALPGPVPLLLERRILSYFLAHGIWLGSFCFGPIRLPFQPLFTWLGINSHISLKIWPESC